MAEDIKYTYFLQQSLNIGLYSLQSVIALDLQECG